MGSRIAVVGAGPAGATLAREAATAGWKVTLFDHRAPWDKPCAGILGRGTVEENPILADYPYPCNYYSGIDVVAFHPHRRHLPADLPIQVLSRCELGAFLLDRAQQAGTEFRKERVLGISRRAGEWSIRTAGGHRAVEQQRLVVRWRDQ